MRVSPYVIAAAFLSSTVILQGCMQSASLPDTQRPTHWGKRLAQPYNFYQVTPLLYRSEQPSALLLPYLKQEHIDIVINLRTRNLDQILLQHSDIQLIHIPLNTWNIQREDIVRVMRILQGAQAEHKRVLIHCYHGSDRTGTMIAMSRILLEGWTVEDALQEMRYGGYGFHPIWVNIGRLFQPQNIEWMRQQLAHPAI